MPWWRPPSLLQLSETREIARIRLLSFDSAVEVSGTALIFQMRGKLKRHPQGSSGQCYVGTRAAVALHDSRDAENLRKLLLLSETKDWRTKFDRRCLYRLKGLRAVDADDTRSVREALFIYAPLAGRLGMHRLKSGWRMPHFVQLYRRTKWCMRNRLWTVAISTSP
jgi:hypothetical protein